MKALSSSWKDSQQMWDRNPDTKQIKNKPLQEGTTLFMFPNQKIEFEWMMK